MKKLRVLFLALLTIIIAFEAVPVHAVEDTTQNTNEENTMVTTKKKAEKAVEAELKEESAQEDILQQEIDKESEKIETESATYDADIADKAAIDEGLAQSKEDEVKIKRKWLYFIGGAAAILILAQFFGHNKKEK